MNITKTFIRNRPSTWFCDKNIPYVDTIYLCHKELEKYFNIPDVPRIHVTVSDKRIANAIIISDLKASTIRIGENKRRTSIYWETMMFLKPLLRQSANNKLYIAIEV